jgi:hypothetical protein
MRALVCLLAFGGAWLGARAQAQPETSDKANHFSTSEYFNPPHQTQLKYLLTGAEARPQGSGKMAITQMKLQTFRENGEREIIAEAPQCIYESAKHEASSAGRLQVQTGDGRFIVEGEGFLWRKNESTLSISNRVHTIIRNAPGQYSKP